MIGMNQYIACMLIGVGISNAFHARDLKKAHISESSKIDPKKNELGWERFATLGNYAGFNFALSAMTTLIFGMIFGAVSDIVFCSVSLVAEGFNLKWRDYRSSAYSVHVGLMSILYRFWHVETTIFLLAAAVVAIVVTFCLRALHHRLSAL